MGGGSGAPGIRNIGGGGGMPGIWNLEQINLI